MKKFICVLLLLSLLPIMSGCACFMALSGKKTPEISDLRKGMSMNEAHLILREYTPAISYEGNKCIEIYEIQIGNDPSLGRALCHGVLDVFTWGLWEIIGTPAEALGSKTMTLTISYSQEMKETPYKADCDYISEYTIDSIKAGKEKGGI